MVEQISALEWRVPSNTRSDVVYVVAETGGGIYSCECVGNRKWRKTCSHIKAVMASQASEAGGMDALVFACDSAKWYQATVISDGLVKPHPKIPHAYLRARHALVYFRASPHVRGWVTVVDGPRMQIPKITMPWFEMRKHIKPYLGGLGYILPSVFSRAITIRVVDDIHGDLSLF
jgi:hypothetical protein